MFRHDRSNKWLSLNIKITITAHFALIIMKGYFFFNTYSLCSVDVNNTYMRIRKMILIMLYKIYCINMQILLIVINHNKGHIIIITKTTIV